jgi:uncharacterized protein (TIGR02246 family)
MRSRLVAAALAMAVLLGVAGVSSAQVATPEALVNDFSAAWNSHDVRLLEAIFARDANWVTVGGSRPVGLADIQAAIAKEHSTWAKTTSIAADNVVGRPLTNEHAVIYYDYEISGVLDREGKPAAPFRGVSLFVASKGARGWQVVAGQTTSVRATSSAEHSPTDDEALLALPWKQFDQTPGAGWRVYAGRNEHRRAAELIETYLARRTDLTPAQRAISHFHAGAELARENLYERALHHLEKAEVPIGTRGVPQDWNELVISTRAFLLGDREALLASKARVDAMQSPAFPDSAARLLQYMGQRYGAWDEER